MNLVVLWKALIVAGVRLANPFIFWSFHPLKTAALQSPWKKQLFGAQLWQSHTSTFQRGLKEPIYSSVPSHNCSILHGVIFNLPFFAGSPLLSTIKVLKSMNAGFQILLDGFCKYTGKESTKFFLWFFSIFWLFLHFLLVLLFQKTSSQRSKPSFFFHHINKKLAWILGFLNESLHPRVQSVISV